MLEEPVISIVSPAATTSVNSNAAKLLSFCIMVYLILTVASLFEETQVFPDQSPDRFEFTSSEPVLHLPISLKTPC